MTEDSNTDTKITEHYLDEYKSKNTTFSQRFLKGLAYTLGITATVFIGVVGTGFGVMMGAGIANSGAATFSPEIVLGCLAMGPYGAYKCFEAMRNFVGNIDAAIEEEARSQITKDIRRGTLAARYNNEVGSTLDAALGIHHLAETTPAKPLPTDVSLQAGFRARRTAPVTTEITTIPAVVTAHQHAL